MALVAVCMTAVTAGAQRQVTYNDTVRTHSWSVYVGGGVNGTSNIRTMERATRRYAGPEGWLGVKYYINPMWRLGINAGYARNKFVNGDLLTTETETPNFTVGEHTTTLNTTAVRLNGDQRSDNFYADLNIDWNILDLWHNRKIQKLNIWLGVGAGFMHADWNGSNIWAVDERALAQGDTWFNVYDHSYVMTKTNHNIANTLYLPVTLSVEWDVTPYWTVGARGQFKYMPSKKDFSPYGMWSAGLTVAYNFNGRKASKPRYVEVVKEVPVEVIREVTKEIVKEKETKVAVAPEFAVFFKINQWELSDESKVNLRLIAKSMKENPDVKYVIQGYADSATGTPSINQMLSERRAQVVYETLIAEGVSADQLQTNANGGQENMFGKDELNRVSIIQLSK